MASGRTFDEAKRAAAEVGEDSVLLGRIPTSQSWLRKSRRLIHLVAVFISLGPATLMRADTDFTTSPPAISVEESEPDAFIPDAAADAEDR